MHACNPVNTRLQTHNPLVHCESVGMLCYDGASVSIYKHMSYCVMYAHVRRMHACTDENLIIIKVSIVYKDLLSVMYVTVTYYFVLMYLNIINR